MMSDENEAKHTSKLQGMNLTIQVKIFPLDSNDERKKKKKGTTTLTKKPLKTGRESDLQS